MTFWVYENTIHKKCRVHRGDCSFCNDGRGIHGGGETNSGRWFGPHAELREAEAFANSRRQPDVRGCGMCTGETVRPAAPQAKPSPIELSAAASPDALPWPWDQAQEFTCSLKLEWVPLGRLALDAKGKLKFPAIASDPGLYRLRTPKAEGRMAVYVGESDNLQRRFQNYRQGSEGQATSHRINGWLKKLLADGSEISISAITETAWFVDGGEQAPADLSAKAVRRLFEQWAITAEHAQDIESLNR
jgi:hypothetical protein